MSRLRQAGRGLRRLRRARSTWRRSRRPFRHPDHVVHNNNVVGSYNALRAAVEHGIMRICQASSVNAIGLSFSRGRAFRLLPARRGAPQLQRGALLRSVEVDLRAAGRQPSRAATRTCRIASMRFHWVVPTPRDGAARTSTSSPAEAAQASLGLHALRRRRARLPPEPRGAASRATRSFYIIAPDTTIDTPSLELAAQYLPGRADHAATSAATGASSRPPRPSACSAGSTTDSRTTAAGRFGLPASSAQESPAASRARRLTIFSTDLRAIARQRHARQRGRARSSRSPALRRA